MKTQLKMTLKRRWMFLMVLFMVSLLAAPNAFGEVGDTDAGATISNQATIVYQVSTVVQPAVNSDNDNNDANGINPTQFLVDHKVKPLVALLGNATVAPNSTGQILTYTLTNAGNTAAPATLDMLLDFEASATDNFDMLVDTVQIWMENGLDATGLQTSGATMDTLVTDYVPAVDVIGYVSLERDTPTTIYLLADTPSTPTNGQIAEYWLVATAWDGGLGIALAEDGADDPAVSEVVWADDLSALPSGDNGLGAVPTAPDGKHAALAIYTVTATTLDVTKTSSVISDPFNTAAPFFRVPGARVQYGILIENTGSVAATNLQVVDRIPAGTDYIDSTATSTAGVASVEYSSQVGIVPPALPTDWTYGPTFVGSVDPAITWIRINLTNPVAGSGSATTQFDVFIR